ncbi:hypothetical protein DVH24_039682 [Malus domestica]|uniref:Uncharacterized protein n=1 Tax=Malus domestica TaxID=3750 RepID=A0A498I870_MALDO|nr:hypothetical protein DVH24_039682 [Malus domestica]
MQSLSASIRLVRRQRVDSSKIAHFRSIGAYQLSGGSGFSSLASDRLASAKKLGDLSGFGSSKSSLFQSVSKFSYRSSAPVFLMLVVLFYQTTTSSQTVAPASSCNSNLFKSARLSSFRCAAVSTPFPSRCIATGGNFVQSATQDSGMSVSDVAPCIKFKRLDKTAHHIMQACVYLFILDKEALEEVKAQREIPDVRPGYMVQLRVEVPDNKRRVSVVKGVVIARRNAGLNTTIRIRRQVAGVGVESLFPLYSPNIKEIKVLDKKKVRRAKLYYVRDKINAFKKQS